MNTARAFGPAAVSGFPNDNHWIVRWAFNLSRSLPSVILRRTCFVFFFFRAVARGKKNRNFEISKGGNGKTP
jgi:hypothetical protein